MDKVHKLHPDKNRHEHGGADTSSVNQRDASSNNARKFIELKHAWEEYDKIMKLNRLSNISAHDNKADSNNDEDEASFTLFGVGCSFADSPSEREYRNEIMEQACRGWFSSGELATGMLESKATDATGLCIEAEGSAREASIEIIGDELFIGNFEEKEEAHYCKSNNKSGSRKSLVQDLDRFKRR